MMLRRIILGCALMLQVGWLRAAGPLDFAGTFSEPFRFSIDVQQADIAARDSGAVWSILAGGLSGGLSETVKIDAIDFISTMKAYFSIDCDAFIGGVLYHDEDIILWSGGVYSVAWSGAANGLPSSADVDALDMIDESPLEFSFSLNSSALLTVGGGSVSVADEDVIHFTTGSGLTAIDFDGSAFGVPAEADIDAFKRLSATQWLMSFDIPVTLAGTSFDDADVAVWNPLATAFVATPFFVASANGIPPEVDLKDIEANPNDLNPYNGRPFGDFDNSRCTDIQDFLFLLDNWQLISPIGAPAIDLNDFLNLLDNWNTGSAC